LVGFVVAVAALDQLTGSHLQLSAPLADNPTVAGRFRGMGNLDFAAFMTAALLLAALLAGRLPRRQAILTVVGIGVFAVIIDGAPPLGDDFGGVIALVPSFALLAALVAGARITVRRIIAVIVGTAIVAIGVALADYSRPAADQTHVGRFVGQVLHGGAWTVVHRKLESSVSTVGFTIGTGVVFAAVIAACLAWSRIVATLREVPGLLPGAIAATVGAVLGVALNDSGIPIAAMAVIVGVSAAYATRSAVTSGGAPLAAPEPRVPA
jgi:hypothetical protein